MGAAPRAVLGFLVSPLATPLVVWAFFAGARLLGIARYAAEPMSDVAARAMLVAVVAAVFAYLATGIVGIPAVLWWSRRRALALRDLARLGLALGALPVVVYGIIGMGIAAWEIVSRPADALGGGWDRWLSQLREVVVLTVLAAASGTATAAVYWLIALRRR